MKRIFIDGSAGTTGLRIYECLFARNDLSLLVLPEELRKDACARRDALNSADIVFLCLPDAAAMEAVSMIESGHTAVIDTSTAHRTASGWTYGFPELDGMREKIAASKRIANPGCHASGFIALIAPLVREGVIPADALLSCFSLTGYSGGGPEISETMSKLGKQPVFVDGLRVTDKETVDIVQMVLAGKINKTLVNLLEMKGGRAMGISGMDGRLIEAKIKDERLGYVGDITNINIKPVEDLLEKGYIPVVSTLGCDREGNAYNINGDTAAAWLAGALKAERLIMLTDIAGILRDKDDPSTLIPAVTISEADRLREEGVISGGMIPKVECCVEAIHKGVQNVIIMDGRVPHSILMEILTDEGAGTMVSGGNKDE